MSCKRMDTEFQELLPDIPQVACRLASGSPNCASRSSVLRPERGLWSRNRPKLGESPRNPQHPGPAATFFGATGRPVLPLSFNFGLYRSHAHDGGARNRRMAWK